MPTWAILSSTVWLTPGSFNPPAIISSCEIENTLVGDGCQLRFSKLTNTVLGRNTFVDVGCDISDSVLLGNRYGKWMQRQSVWDSAQTNCCSIS